jgi:hypothetical protein
MACFVARRSGCFSATDCPNIPFRHGRVSKTTETALLQLSPLSNARRRLGLDCFRLASPGRQRVSSLPGSEWWASRWMLVVAISILPRKH